MLFSNFQYSFENEEKGTFQLFKKSSLHIARKVSTFAARNSMAP